MTAVALFPKAYLAAPTSSPATTGVDVATKVTAESSFAPKAEYISIEAKAVVVVTAGCHFHVLISPPTKRASPVGVTKAGEVTVGSAGFTAVAEFKLSGIFAATFTN